MSLELILEGIEVVGLLTVGLLEFIDKRSGMTIVNTSESLNENEKSELKAVRIELSKVLISVWKHASMSDGVFQKEEELYANKMIEQLFYIGSLFPIHIFDKDEIKTKLYECIKFPLTLEEIKSYTQKNPEIAKELYDNASSIIAEKKHLKKSEEEFLKNFALLLNVSK
jgi:hypothetical protein